ncbi:type IV pili methyl-accepting chemotaxis transducer N-terminal domain-containing protein [Maribacter sp. 2210JD10-5]|uniref:PAS domain-containing sensor histidine kinase n=1 Tax=Maribacter sp. 2210JD10-5 TaxID=3386272 RepID=UPI0039BC838C
MQNKNPQHQLDTVTFFKVRRRYLFAIAAIALTVILAQVLIQQHLNNQLDDSRVINVAGRQRALSQKLTKEALLIVNRTSGSIAQESNLKRLKTTLRTWQISHKALQYGNDSMGLSKERNKIVLKLFEELDPYHQAMVKATEELLKKDVVSTKKEFFNPQLKILLENEQLFLSKMDAIVNEYDAQSKKQLQALKFKEYLLLGFSLFILLLEIIFLFRPLSIQIKETISKLIQSQNESDKATQEIKTLFLEKEKSLKELQELNFVIDNAALFASARKDGSIVFISKKFLELLGHSSKDLKLPLSEVLTTDEGQQTYLKEVLRSNRKNVIRSEELKIETKKGVSVWLDMSIIPMHQSSLNQSILILCSDITERKNNQLKIEELTKQNYEENIRQKQQQASLIVEGQEEERKRIAKDIHDGIGQMLTALKFNIESIDLSEQKKTEEKIAYLKELCSDLIKGVRTATFNLTPPELEDHGIFPALQKMTTELSRLTGKNILFDNKAESNIRFNALAETNIYRVAQEAVNNAIKYAASNYILVTINHKDGILSVVIDDDGKGFDTSTLNDAPKHNSEGGMGVLSMKERISYINGRLFINSILGKGTRVTINYKINNTFEDGKK